MTISLMHYKTTEEARKITIDGLKGATIEPTDNGYMVDLRFNTLADIKILQDELNKAFPENVKFDSRFIEPEQDGFYLTQTGILLKKDEQGDWSIRNYSQGAFTSAASEVNPLGNDGAPYESKWSEVIKKLGTEAFPLVAVSISPLS